MSYFVKMVNEDKGIHYNTYSSVERLIYYIYGLTESNYDGVRPGHAIGDFNGCIPFIGPDDMQHDSDEAVNLMLLHLRMYGYKDNDADFIKHRIISFHMYDYILPNDAENLAKYILSSLYKDYLSVFAVHLDTDKIHIHLAINTVGLDGGKKFSVSYEYNSLVNIVKCWYDRHCDYLESSPGLKEKYEKYLFGEGLAPKKLYQTRVVFRKNR